MLSCSHTMSYRYLSVVLLHECQLYMAHRELVRQDITDSGLNVDNSIEEADLNDLFRRLSTLIYVHSCCANRSGACNAHHDSSIEAIASLLA